MTDMLNDFASFKTEPAADENGGVSQLEDNLPTLSDIYNEIESDQYRELAWWSKAN